MSDYSKTPLYQKLGLKENMDILILNEPDNYEKSLGSVLQTVHKQTALENEKMYDFIQLFTHSKKELQDFFPQLKNFLKQSGMLWISWPKGTYEVGVTNLTDTIVRNIGLANGLVDVKIVSVNEIWSGIKFVYRLKDRL